MNNPRPDPFIENIKNNEARFVQAFLAQGQAAQAARQKEEERKRKVQDAINAFKERRKIINETGGGSAKAAQKITDSDIQDIGTTLLEQTEAEVPRTQTGELGGLAGILERNMPFAAHARNRQQGRYDQGRSETVNQILSAKLQPFLKQQLGQFMPGGQPPEQTAGNILGNASPPAMPSAQGQSQASVMAPGGPASAPVQAQAPQTMEKPTFQAPAQNDGLPDPSKFKPGSVIEMDDGTRYKVEKGKWVKQ